jgi:uncharacterized protein YkwD
MPARRSSRHQAARSHRRLGTVLAVIATGVVVAVLSFVTTTTAARFLLAGGTATVADIACPSPDSASPPGCPTAPTAGPRTRDAVPAVPATTDAPATKRPSPTAAARSPDQPPEHTTAASTPPAAAPGSAAEQVLGLINNARAQAGLPAYTVTGGLRTSSGRHNAVMASGCGLSHQCPGEPSLGARETAAGVTWTSAGENIGEGGPVANRAAAIAQMAVTLTQGMLDEQPPDDGHRKNILSSAFHHIGIAIHRDSHGTVWMTQDFSN